MPGGQLGLEENPFGEGHDPRFLYPSRAHWEAVTRLRRAVDNREPFVYLTGPAGCGKTTALLDFLAGMELHTVVVIAAAPSLTLAEFYERLLSGLGCESTGSAIAEQPADRVEALLREMRARGDVVILVVDESQNLGPEVLEELMLLSDLEAGESRLLQIILAGQPTLERLLSRPGCEALRPRVAVRCWLGAFSAEETEGYILHRVSVVSGASRSLFPSDSCQAVYGLTHGIPRDINLLASEALVQAEAAGASGVKPAHVAAAARVVGLVRPDAAAWVARFGQACGPPEIGARIGAARSLFETIEFPAEAADRGVLPLPPSRLPSAPQRALPSREAMRPGRPGRTVAWVAGALLIVALGFVLSIAGRNATRGSAAHRPGTSVPTAEANREGVSSTSRRVPPVGALTAAQRVSRPPTSAVTQRPGLAPRRTGSASLASRPAGVPKATHSAPAPPEARRRYGIEVAAFLVESRALEERDKLAPSISVGCSVVSSLEDGAQLYRVVVGPLASRSEAERLGAELSARGVVGEARVVRWMAADSTRR